MSSGAEDETKGRRTRGLERQEGVGRNSREECARRCFPETEIGERHRGCECVQAKTCELEWMMWPVEQRLQEFGREIVPGAR